MSHWFERLLHRGPIDRSVPIRPLVPADPAASGAWHDPSIAGIRAGLGPFRRRLWIRRIVRRAWLVVAGALTVEAGLWALARVVPLERAPVIAAAIPVVAAVVLLIVAVMARPSIGETAIAVDVEGGLRDRLTSALALANKNPASQGDEAATIGPFDVSAGPDREGELLQRQRRDAVHALSAAPPDLFRPRARRAPMAAALVSALLLVPLLSPAQRHGPADRAGQGDPRGSGPPGRPDRQGGRGPGGQGAIRTIRGPGSPRSCATWRSSCATIRRARRQPGQAGQRRGRPPRGDRPATEQRAAALASLSRALSGATTGKPDANRDGDPDKAAADIEKAAAELDKLTPSNRPSWLAA